MKTFKTLFPLALVVCALLVGCTEKQPPAAHSNLQLQDGQRTGIDIVASFDGIGVGFEGPQGTSQQRNPSDNSLAVGPDHIIQTVNTRTAIFTKKGAKFGETGRALYGPVGNNNFFKGFGGACEETNNGDTVVTFDQLANRWLVVMPIFRRLAKRANEPAVPTPADGPVLSTPGNENQPGPAATLFQPERMSEEEVAAAMAAQQAERERRRSEPPADGTFAMCYAISATDDPMGEWYRYEFVRPLFPDYPRPAVWPDGYYVPTSTGDTIIEKHACVVEREKMLLGQPARELCIIIPDVNFLNNADLDGLEVPAPGTPNPMLATGGSQLTGKLGDDKIQLWNFFVDWDNISNTRVEGPMDLKVEPYAFLCGGQLTECVPQPGTEQRLDSQGDKLMARVLYRKRGNVESIVAAHSVAVGYDGPIQVETPPQYGDGGFSPASGGGVKWYEFRIGEDRTVTTYQEGTYAPGVDVRGEVDSGPYRWLPSPAMDKFGNIGVGYSWGSAEDYAGQRFAGRTPSDSLGQLALSEMTLITGSAAQTYGLRWEDYTQTAIDPSDDCTVWYVGDYYQPGATGYSTRIGGFQMPGCKK
jgi:hypothetical protein